MQLRAIVGYESSGDKVGTSINGLIVPPTGIKKEPRRSLVIELERMYWTMKLVSLVDKQRLTLSGSSSGIIRKRRYCFLSVRKMYNIRIQWKYYSSPLRMKDAKRSSKVVQFERKNYHIVIRYFNFFKSCKVGEFRRKKR